MQVLQQRSSSTRPSHGRQLRLRQPFKAPSVTGSVQRVRATESQEAASANNSIDIDTQVELFMRKQAELESGAAFVKPRDPEKIIGGDIVNEELAKAYCREIFEILKVLKVSRDMSVMEIKLIVSIEDPRAKERRAAGIEDDRGVSRDEMAAVVTEIAEGRIPKDRIALKCLYDEMKEWPFLDSTAELTPGGGTGAPSSAASSSAASSPAPTASDYATLMGENGGTGGRVKPYIMGQTARNAVAGEKPENLTDMLPDWVGYGALYGISTIPVLLAVGAILVLFYNSLK